MPESTTDIVFESTYSQRLDDKRRVPVPHRWRSGKTEDFHLMIWPKHKAGTCLRGLSPGLMTQFLQKLDALPDNHPDKALLKRQLGSQTITVTVDNAGRIAIPEEMALKADIKTDAIFVGLLDRFEIWSPRRYEDAKTIDSARLNEALQMLE